MGLVDLASVQQTLSIKQDMHTFGVGQPTQHDLNALSSCVPPVHCPLSPILLSAVSASISLLETLI